MSNIKHHNLKSEKLFTLIFLAGLLFSSISCVTNKQMVYVQPEKEEQEIFEAIEKQDRVIEAGDELYIRILSDDEQTNIFRQRTDNYYLATADITLVSYLVNEEGFVRLPPIGDIQLKGLKLDEASKVIEMTLVGIISNPSVSMKFVNKTVTVLGEVNEPGRHEFYDQRINIFQALGYAGDIAEYGNRKNVMLIREENNVITRNYIDLTDENLLTSYYFYVKPNDVIYVEPLKRRHWGIDTFPFALILTSISTFVLVLSYINLYSGAN